MRRKYAILLVCIIIAVVLSSIVIVIMPGFAQGTVILYLEDTETCKPIGRVGNIYPLVFIDDVVQGFVSDTGKIRIEKLSPGSHKFTINIPYYGNYTDYINVNAWQTTDVKVTVDMPNPIFDIAIHVEQNALRTEGTIYITITNTGTMPSLGTQLLLLIFRDDNPTTPVDEVLLYVGELLSPSSYSGTNSLIKSNGKSQLISNQFYPYIRPFEPPKYYFEPKIYTNTKTLAWKTSAFDPGVSETIVAVILDNWQFTPQNRKVMGEINIPVDQLESLIASVMNWIKDRFGPILDAIVTIALNKLSA
jgi:hypothetical protein